MKIPRIILLAALASAIFSGATFGQDALKPRPATAKPAKTKIERTTHETERISVKFRDDLPVRLRGGKLAAMDADARALNPAAGLLQRLEAAGAKWERMHTVAEEKLTEMRDKGQRKTGKQLDRDAIEAEVGPARRPGYGHPCFAIG